MDDKFIPTKYGVCISCFYGWTDSDGIGCRCGDIKREELTQEQKEEIRGKKRLLKQAIEFIRIEEW